MKKRVILIVLAVLVALLVLAVTVPLIFINSLVKQAVATAGPKVAKVEMSLAGANISIFSGKGTLSGLFVGNPEGYRQPFAFKAGEITLAVKPSSLFSDRIVVNTVRIVGPDITFEGGPQDNNFTKILANVQSFTGGSAAGGKSAGGPSKKLQVDEFTLTGAKVTASTQLSGGQPITLTLPDIHLTGLGAGPEGITASDLTALLLKEVSGKTVAAIGHSVSKLGAAVVNSAGKAAGDAVGTATKSVGDLTKGLGGLLKKK